MLYTDVSFTGRSWIIRKPAEQSHVTCFSLPLGCACRTSLRLWWPVDQALNHVL